MGNELHKNQRRKDNHEKQIQHIFTCNWKFNLFFNFACTCGCGYFLGRLSMPTKWLYLARTTMGGVRMSNAKTVSLGYH